jgi:predicted nicotinamide N-methyase
LIYLGLRKVAEAGYLAARAWQGKLIAAASYIEQQPEIVPAQLVTNLA